MDFTMAVIGFWQGAVLAVMVVAAVATVAECWGAVRGSQGDGDGADGPSATGLLAPLAPVMTLPRMYSPPAGRAREALAYHLLIHPRALPPGVAAPPGARTPPTPYGTWGVGWGPPRKHGGWHYPRR